jgi:hypothetical protein
MSDASDSAHVRIFLADYAVADDKGKFTMVGGGIAIIGLNPLTGTTAPFTVVALVTFDPQFIGESPAIEFALETEHGQLVTLPGQPGPLRMAMAEKLNPPMLQGANVPNDAVRPKHQMLMQFQNGLPLPAGTGYRWRITIDQQTNPEWTEGFYVPTASLGPVLH